MGNDTTNDPATPGPAARNGARLVNLTFDVLFWLSTAALGIRHHRHAGFLVLIVIAILVPLLRRPDVVLSPSGPNTVVGMVLLGASLMLIELLCLHQARQTGGAA